MSTSTADLVKQALLLDRGKRSQISDRLWDSLEEILFVAVSEMGADVGILTFLDDSQQQLLPRRPHAFATQELLDSGIEIPVTFKSPVSNPSAITTTWGRASYPEGFGSENEFDKLVREKAFLPLVIAEQIAVFCGVVLKPASQTDFRRIGPFWRSKLTAGWCLIQKRLSEEVPACDGHQNFANAIEQLALASKSKISNVEDAQEACLSMLQSFGVSNVKLSIIRKRRAPEDFAGIPHGLSDRDSWEGPRCEIPICDWNVEGSGRQLRHVYCVGNWGLEVCLQADERRETTLDDRVLLTILLERILWKMALFLEPPK